MARVTDVSAVRAGIAVAVDGARWRVLPEDVVAAAGLRAGVELDRGRVRRLRRELRRYEAIRVATRALRRRDLSRAQIEQRLAQNRVPRRERDDVVERLASAGYLDDERLAANRAASLAERDAGDAAIRYELRRRGIDPALAERAVSELEPEARRAEGIVRKRGPGMATARYLARKGFTDESLAHAGDVAIHPEGA